MLSLDDVLQTLKSNVRLKKRDLKLLKRELELRLAEGAEEERITQLNEDIANCQEDLDQVRDKFEIATEGIPVKKLNNEIGEEFCEEYIDEFNEMGRITASFEVKMKYLKEFYHSKCELNIIGYKNFVGRDAISKCLYEKYKGLRVSQKLLSIHVDENPPKYCDVYVDCKSLITIENDKPRKVKQVDRHFFSFLQSLILHNMKTFALVRSGDSSQEIEFVALKEIFLVQDSRPLYHFPEIDLNPQLLEKKEDETVTGKETLSSSQEEEEDSDLEEEVDKGTVMNVKEEEPKEFIPAPEEEPTVLIRRMGIS